MAKKNTTRKHERIDFQKIKFVIDNLSAAQLKEHDKQPLSCEEIMQALLILVDKGASISIKQDFYTGKGYLSTATFGYTGFEPNSGFAISARGSDIADGLSIVSYKFFNVANENLAEMGEYEEGFRRG